MGDDAMECGVREEAGPVSKTKRLVNVSRGHQAATRSSLAKILVSPTCTWTSYLPQAFGAWEDCLCHRSNQVWPFESGDPRVSSSRDSLNTMALSQSFEKLR